MGMYSGPRRQTTGTQDLLMFDTKLPMKAAKDTLKLAVVLLPASLQPLITHFGHKIITARCK